MELIPIGKNKETVQTTHEKRGDSKQVPGTVVDAIKDASGGRTCITLLTQSQTEAMVFGCYQAYQ